MWGALISAAASAVGMAMNAVQNRKAREAQQAEARRQAAYYENKANENPLMRADNQYLLKQYDKDAQEQVRRQQAVGAIMGHTPEQALAVQKQVADGRVDLMGKLAAENESRRDKLLESAEKARQTGAENAIKYEQERAKSWGQLVSNAGSAFKSMDFDDNERTTSGLKGYDYRTTMTQKETRKALGKKDNENN